MHVPACPKCGVMYTFAQCGLREDQPREQVTVCCECGWQFRFRVIKKTRTSNLARLFRRRSRELTHTTKPHKVELTERIGHGS